MSSDFLSRRAIAKNMLGFIATMLHLRKNFLIDILTTVVGMYDISAMLAPALAVSNYYRRRAKKCTFPDKRTAVANNALSICDHACKNLGREVNMV